MYEIIARHKDSERVLELELEENNEVSWVHNYEPVPYTKAVIFSKEYMHDNIKLYDNDDNIVQDIMAKDVKKLLHVSIPYAMQLPNCTELSLTYDDFEMLDDHTFADYPYPFRKLNVIHLCDEYIVPTVIGRA